MKWIAHRGYSAKYPENTMIAFDQAVLHGVQMIELDVLLTKDQKIVVIHDDTLDRTTSGSGRVCELTYDHIKALDAGSWKNSSFDQERVPLLSDVLDQWASEVAFQIEIKKEAVALDETQSIEKPLMNLLARYGGAKSIQISSFEPLALHRFYQQMRSLPRCYLTVQSATQEQRQEMAYLDVHAHHISIEHIDQEEVNNAHAQGMKIRTYTVNDKASLEYARSLSVDGVFSDYVDAGALL